jgi:hypothetical protein
MIASPTLSAACFNLSALFTGSFPTIYVSTFAAFLAASLVTLRNIPPLFLEDRLFDFLDLTNLRVFIVCNVKCVITWPHI